MMTTVSTFAPCPSARSMSLMVMACERISPAVRLRAMPCRVEAQKAQPMLQPACVETQMLLP